MSNVFDIQRTQRVLYRKARRCPRHRFNDLRYRACQTTTIEAAVRRVLLGPGARTPGSDGMARHNYSTPEEQQGLVRTVHNHLRDGLYVTLPMVTTRISKRKGGFREISIPTVRDRVVSSVLQMLLQPIFEPDFSPYSHGYRVGQSTMDNMLDAQRSIKSDRLWVLRLDLKDCFKSIDPDRMLKLLDTRIADRWILEMVKSFLEANVLTREFALDRVEGIPQGLGLGALLVNIYLTELDKWIARRFSIPGMDRKAGRVTHPDIECVYTRYVDDIAIFCREVAPDAFVILGEVKDYLEMHGMELSAEELVHATEGFDFLGLHLQWQENTHGVGHLVINPSIANVQRFRQRIIDLMNEERSPERTVGELNNAISSFGSQFRFVQSRRQFGQLDRWVALQFQSWLSSRTAIDGQALSKLPLLKKLMDIKRTKYQPRLRPYS